MKPGQSPWILICALAVWATSRAIALDTEFLRFVSAKEAQARELAKVQTNKVPSIVWSFFDAVRVDDWETATNLGARLSRAGGRAYDPNENEPLATALQYIWPPVHEIIGAYGEFHDWNSKWLHRFGRDVIDSIPKGSIYFGGTDSGRFVISALSESHREGRPFFTLTQNQLADGTYLEYLRTMYGNRIQIPSAEEMWKVFNDYAADAARRLKAGQLKPGENVQVVNGQIQVSGQVAVMELNGRLARTILQKNPDREFYLEQSLPMEWMYPYLSPHGPIFELYQKSLTELRVETVRQDQDYWKRLLSDALGDWLTEKTSLKEVCDFADKIYLRKDLTGFKGDAAFAGNDAAQRCFSKLRSSIADLYQWRAAQTKDPEEKVRMWHAADLAYRQALALCPSSPEVAFGYSGFLQTQQRHEDAVRLAETFLRHDPDNSQAEALVRLMHKLD